MAPSQKIQLGVPLSAHHPSQSSVDVPQKLKDEIKDAQGWRCWLCNDIARQGSKALQISHVLVQAGKKRNTFIRHHKAGRTQLDNIHGRRNLLALCQGCHLAWDNEEWSFLPILEDMTAWLEEIRANPSQAIQRCNARTDVRYRRLLLDPYTEAHQDKSYRSAFKKLAIKKWGGEPGAVILRNYAILADPPVDDTDTMKIFNVYRELHSLWSQHKSSCPLKDCLLCGSSDEETEDVKEHGDDNENDQEDRDDNGDEQGDENEKDEKEDRDSYDDDEGSTRTDDDDADYDPNTRPSRSSKKRRRQWSVSSPTAGSLNSLTKATKPSRDKWIDSAPYDETVPFSHRYGYTWAGSTANEVMAMWQINREPAEEVK